VKDKIKKREATIVGWVNYLRIVKAKSRMEELDSWVRMHLRMGLWKQWKKPTTRRMNLKRLGISAHKAREWGGSSK
jgi:RNA-directed DNA polymerase